MNYNKGNNTGLFESHYVGVSGMEICYCVCLKGMEGGIEIENGINRDICL